MVIRTPPTAGRFSERDTDAKLQLLWEQFFSSTKPSHHPIIGSIHPLHPETLHAGSLAPSPLVDNYLDGLQHSGASEHSMKTMARLPGGSLSASDQIGRAH